MVKKITQSLIKDCIKYFSGNLCGNIMRERWVKGRLLMDGHAMSLGSYFEFQFTLLMTGVGSLPKNGKTPVATLTQKGEKTADYKRADANALRLQRYFGEMGLNILHAGKKLTQGRFEGTIDLICQVSDLKTFDGGITWQKGDIIVIDLKYSGLIDDNWNAMGWGAMTRAGSNAQKDHHGIQAKQYFLVSKGMPFYYLIMPPSNEEDILFLHVPVTAEMVEDHMKGGNALLEKFEFEAQMGFEARPELMRCNACPLKAECKDKHTFPHPITVEL